MADPIVAKVEAAVATVVPSLKAKVAAYVKTHATPTVIGTLAGFVTGKFGLIGLLFKVL